jgi:BarA-like signal transduction histidine kinase
MIINKIGLKSVTLTKMLDIGLSSEYKIHAIQLIQGYPFHCIIKLHLRVKATLKI